MEYVAILFSVFVAANNFIFFGRYIRRPGIYLILTITVNLAVTLSTYFFFLSIAGIEAIAESEGARPEHLYLNLKLSIAILLPITLSFFIAWLMRKKGPNQ